MVKLNINLVDELSIEEEMIIGGFTYSQQLSNYSISAIDNENGGNNCTVGNCVVGCGSNGGGSTNGNVCAF